MIPALYDDDRRALMRLASMLIAGALCILPLTTQTSPIAGAAGMHDLSDVAKLAPPARLTFPGYRISRDPFVVEGKMRAMLDVGGAPMSVGQGSDIGVVLPPNAAATQGSLPRLPLGLEPIVRAIVLGDPPRALVEVGGAVRVVGVGDRLGTLAVVGIASGRVTLSDGSSLTLDGNHK
jgi:hypothetical protein